ncbi:phosphatase PAP2 family protein [Flavobacteriaceae bacterium]|nr:phosphatase PAP2 family protein [Flavobacteriaceae bacterium]
MKSNIQYSFYFRRAIIGITMILLSCNNENTTLIQPHQLAWEWADMTLFITKNTPANSPTFASRALGYIGLTMYETVVHKDSTYQSLSGQLNALENLPLPEKNKEYYWPLALNSGQAAILKHIYLQTSEENKQKIDSLERVLKKKLAREVSNKAVIDRSVAFGKDIAEAIFEWSKNDGGHRGYLNNFDKSYTPKVFPGSWQPPLFAQSFSHHPLHPYWGNNRTFSLANQELDLPEIIPYSTDKNSAYYKEFYEVYEAEKALTDAQKQTAIWWSDDPDVTFSPGGHLYYIAGILVKYYQPDLMHSAKTYAQVGMAVADAFILCWRWKYHFFSERPNTFIPKNIDIQWESFWPDPPFPSFPSGHAIQAGAAATALMDLYENNTVFIDSAHAGRERDHVRDTDFVPRKYNSIWEVADETAQSRFLGGIHTKQDNLVGLEQGKIIADNINKMQWRE